MAKNRPGQLTAIAIIAIVIGVLGSCVSSFTFLSTATQGLVNDFNRANMESMHGPGAEQLQRQLELQERLQEVTDSWMPFTLTHQVLNLFASLALGIAGILLLRWKKLGLTLFVGAAGVGILVDTLGAVLGFLAQLEMKPILREFLAASGENGPAGFAETMGAFGEASASASMCMAIGFLIIKIAYYAWGIVVVRKDEIRALYG